MSYDEDNFRELLIQVLAIHHDRDIKKTSYYTELPEIYGFDYDKMMEEIERRAVKKVGLPSIKMKYNGSHYVAKEPENTKAKEKYMAEVDNLTTELIRVGNLAKKGS